MTIFAKHAQHNQKDHGNWADGGLPEVEAKHEAPYGEPKPSVWDVKSLSLDSGDAGDLHEAKRRWFIAQSDPQVWEAIDTALDQSADSNVWDRTPLARSVGRVFSGDPLQSDLDKGVALQRQWTKMVWKRMYGDKKTIPVLRVEGGPHAGKMTGLVSYAVPENRSQLERMTEQSGGKLVESVVSADNALLLFWGEGRFRSNYVSVKGEVLAWESSRVGKRGQVAELAKHAVHDQKDHGNRGGGRSNLELLKSQVEAAMGGSSGEIEDRSGRVRIGPGEFDEESNFYFKGSPFEKDFIDRGYWADTFSTASRFGQYVHVITKEEGQKYLQREGSAKVPGRHFLVKEGFPKVFPFAVINQSYLGKGFDAAVTVRQTKRGEVAELLKHAAPIHPGTGSGQDVHGGDSRSPAQRQRDRALAASRERRKAREDEEWRQRIASVVGDKSKPLYKVEDGWLTFDGFSCEKRYSGPGRGYGSGNLGYAGMSRQERTSWVAKRDHEGPREEYDFDSFADLKAWAKARHEEKVEKHAAPVHPGTGSDQSVHGGGKSRTIHWADDPYQPRFTSFVPTDFLMSIREFDRDDQDVAAVAASLKEEGWRAPVIIEIRYEDDGKILGLLTEGNHRVEAAHSLGWKEVPAKIIVRSYPFYNETTHDVTDVVKVPKSGTHPPGIKGEYWTPDDFFDWDKVKLRKRGQVAGLLKHAVHDQKDHGNWADGTSEEGPASGASDPFTNLYGRLEGQGDKSVDALWTVMGAPTDIGREDRTQRIGRDADNNPIIEHGGYNKYSNWETTSTEPIQHLFRVVSEDDFQRMQAQGFVDTHGELNFGDEGTNTSSRSTGTFYMPQQGAGRIVRIDYRPEDGWKVDPADEYVKTHTPIPFDRVSMVSPVIDARIEAEPSSMAASHPDLFGNRMFRRTNRYVLQPGEQPVEQQLLVTHGDVRRAYGGDYMGGFDKPEEPVEPPTRRGLSLDRNLADPAPVKKFMQRLGIAKHMGPGDHPSGSSQDVHGGGARLSTTTAETPTGFLYSEENRMRGGEGNGKYMSPVEHRFPTGEMGQDLEAILIEGSRMRKRFEDTMDEYFEKRGEHWDIDSRAETQHFLALNRHDRLTEVQQRAIKHLTDVVVSDIPGLSMTSLQQMREATVAWLSDVTNGETIRDRWELWLDKRAVTHDRIRVPLTDLQLADILDHIESGQIGVRRFIDANLNMSSRRIGDTMGETIRFMEAWEAETKELIELKEFIGGVELDEGRKALYFTTPEALRGFVAEAKYQASEFLGSGDRRSWSALAHKLEGTMAPLPAFDARELLDDTFWQVRVAPGSGYLWGIKYDIDSVLLTHASYLGAQGEMSLQFAGRTDELVDGKFPLMPYGPTSHTRAEVDDYFTNLDRDARSQVNVKGSVLVERLLEDADSFDAVQADVKSKFKSTSRTAKEAKARLAVDWRNHIAGFLESEGIEVGVEAPVTTKRGGGKQLADAGLVLPAEWMRGLKEKYGQISFATGESRGFNQGGSFIQLESKRDIAIHELGHSIEVLPGINAPLQAFYDYRTTNSPKEKLQKIFPARKYRADEMTRPDSFPDFYTGRDYRSNRSDLFGLDANYEILSNGLDNMYEDYDSYRAKIDLEHIDFLFGLIVATGKP